MARLRIDGSSRAPWTYEPLWVFTGSSYFCSWASLWLVCFTTPRLRSLELHPTLSLHSFTPSLSHELSNGSSSGPRPVWGSVVFIWHLISFFLFTTLASRALKWLVIIATTHLGSWCSLQIHFLYFLLSFASKCFTGSTINKHIISIQTHSSSHTNTLFWASNVQ